MLLSLTIRDFAIVERLTVEWQPGLTALTGETGAGKSILIDAVSALLGDKAGPTDVRAGASRAYLEAVFSVEPDAPDSEALREVLDELGLELEDGLLIVSREIAGAGSSRSIARINGRAVPLAALARIGQMLVDIHGQSQHLSLLRPRDQLDQLDRFAGLSPERRRMAALARELRAAREEIEALLAEQRAALREQDLLRFQIEEISAADPRPEEEAELQARRTRLRNLERLRNAVFGAYRATAGGDEAPGGLDRVGEALALVQDAARFDASLSPHVERLLEATTALEDVERGLRRYLDDLDADPSQLEAIEERVHVLAGLKRKYGPTLDDVLAYLAEARRRLASIEHGDERLAELREREQALAAEAAELATVLATRRRAAAAELERRVEAELGDLGMAGARFRVSFSTAEAADGLPVALPGREPTPLRFDATGVDRVEFLLAANPAEGPRPLGQVASGGELARVSLAIKTVLSSGDQRGTLIFDEVDVGVGGRKAGVVGQKLWELSRTHQVLCVTHLPQVAAFADQHLLVSKQQRGGRNQTQVQPLEGEERIAELAAMLAGPQPSLSALASARELIDRAAALKRGQAAAAAPSPRG